MSDLPDTGQAQTLEELRSDVLAFMYWISHNEFSDPQQMLVCAEWFNLCAAVGVPMTMAGSQMKDFANE